MALHLYRSPALVLLTLVTIGLLAVVGCGGGSEAPAAPMPEVATEMPKQAAVVAEPTKEAAQEAQMAATATAQPAPASSTGDAASSPIVGGHIPLQAYAAPDHWGTHSSGTLNSIMHSSPMYNQLIEYNDETNDNDDIRGDIAASWEIANNGLSYVFEINEGVTFHDGTPLDAEDVAFSLNRMVEPGETRPRAGEIKAYMEFGGAKAIDARTVQTDLKFAAADFITFLAADVMKIVSKDLVESGADITKLDNVVGSGPFTVREHKRDVSTEYEFNPNYFKTGIGGARKPYLDGMTYFVIVEKGTIIAAYKTGQVLMSVTVTTNLSRSERAKLIEDMGGDLLEHGSTYGGITALMFNTTREPFDDWRVRKAISLAIHRPEAIAIGADGEGILGLPLPPGTWFGRTREEAALVPGYRSTPEGDKHPDDIAEAKRLLEEAGFPDGFETKLSYRNVVSYPVLAPVYKDHLKRNLNINVTLEALESSTGLKRWRDRDFGMAVQGHAFSTYAPDGILGALYRPGGTRNYIDYEAPVVEERFGEQAAELDQEQRKVIIREMEDHLIDVPPNWVGVYWGVGASKLAHKSIKNIFGTPSTQNQMKQENIWLDPSEVN